MSHGFWLTALLLLGAAATAAARSYTLGSTGFEMSGDIAITFRELDRNTTLNTNTRGDDAFNTIRARTFIQKQWNEKMDLYLEFLWDVDAPPRIQGAYLTIHELLDKSLSLKVGMIPSAFGNFGQRSTYFNQNLLIGVPALWLSKTPLASNGGTSNSDLFPYVQRPGGARVFAGGYDACWDYGMDLFIEAGILEVQLALTEGAISNPHAVTNDGYQGISNLGLRIGPGLHFGGSVAYGPWIEGGADLSGYVYPYSTYSTQNASAEPKPARTDAAATQSAGSRVEDYMQTAAGGYAEYSFGRYQFYSEFANIRWDAPFIYEGELSANTGYLEGVWHLLPGWYIASRYDRAWYGEVASNDDGTGEVMPWAPDFNRIEAALGWRVIREGFIRLDYQRTMYDSDQLDSVNLLALQFLFAF